MNDDADATLVATLNRLLEGERAGARVARLYSSEAPDSGVRDTLRRVGRDEAWCCAMLTGHIERLGGRVSRRTGDFLQKALRRESLAERLALLARGQDWVVSHLDELIPRVEDAKLVHDLQRMHDMHRRNVARCVALGASTVTTPGDAA